MLVDNASYPTPAIEENSHKFRPLGLGYANLGALLMATGLPYDSDEGRAYAAAITSLMCGEAYLAVVARSPRSSGPSRATRPTATRSSTSSACTATRRTRSRRTGVPTELYEAQTAVWDAALESGKQYGYKNGQVTVLAPTGTIGFMMDCDTTGVEPDLALVKYKKLVGGGTIKIVNKTVPLALKRLGYAEARGQRDRRLRRREGDDRGRAGLQARAPARLRLRLPRVERHALDPLHGARPDDGAPSSRSSPARSRRPSTSRPTRRPRRSPSVYMEGWKQGLKAIAIYRDGCKRTQPLEHRGVQERHARPRGARLASSTSARPRRPCPRPSAASSPTSAARSPTSSPSAGHEGYITVGLYEDGKPGEIFLRMSKEGSTISGLMDAFATAISLTLQYGVPLEALVDKFTPHALRARRASRRTPRSRSPSPSWTTSSGGSARSS